MNKSNDITNKITQEFAIEQSPDIWEKINADISLNQRNVEKRENVKRHFKLRPIIVTAIIFVLLTVTAVASAPSILNLMLSTTITQDNMNYIEGLEHNIILDSVSLSPLGNILMITEKGGDSPLNQELFENFFIVDDKGNFYGQTAPYINSRRNWEEDITYKVEFFGSVPPNAQYLKLIPYNYNPIPELCTWLLNPAEYERAKLEVDLREFYFESKADVCDLPYIFKQSEYGNVLIESCVVTDEDITVTYKCEGMVISPRILPTDGVDSISSSGQLACHRPIYNPDTDSYTAVFTLNRPIGNLQDIVKGLKVIQFDIELLEEQAIIIPLK